MRILLVEDDLDLAGSLAAQLTGAAFVVDQVHSLGDAIEALISVDYRAVMLDRRLPDGDGLSLLPVAATRQPAPPVLIMTALDDLPSRLAGLEAGADDYLIKPFAFEELRARLFTRIRRAPTGSPPLPVTVGGLRYDLFTREVEVDGQVVSLPRRELAVLDLLVRRAGRVVLREHIEAQVYGFDDAIQSNALESHVSRLRRRLSEAGVIIDGLRGVGYILRAAP